MTHVANVAQSFVTSVADGNASQAAALLDVADPSTELLSLVEDFRDVYIGRRVPPQARRLVELLNKSRHSLGYRHREAREALHELAFLLRRGSEAKFQRAGRTWLEQRSSQKSLAKAIASILVDKRKIFEHRAEQYPVLREWLKLKIDSVRVKVDKGVGEPFIKEQYQSAFSPLVKAAELLGSKEGLLPESVREGFLRILSAVGFSRDEKGSLVIPPLEKMTPQNLAHLRRVFMALLKGGHQKEPMSQEDLNVYRHALLNIGFVVNDYQRLLQQERLIYEISLWERNEKVARKLGLPLEILEDPSVEVIVAKGKGGEILGGLVLRVFQHAKNKRFYVLYSFADQAYGGYRRISKEVMGELLKAAVRGTGELIGSPPLGSSSQVAQATWFPHMPLFPVTAPLNVEQVIAGIESQFFHPLRVLEKILLFGGYEAMRRIHGAKGFKNPWLGEDLPFDLDSIIFREIEPDPDITQVENYLWGYAGNNGRSVDYYLEGGWKDKSETQWYHLSAIGVGKTLKARAGDERRNGRLHLEDAWRRFYLTNLMHAVAQDVGFRTSLGVAVVELPRQGEERQGVVYELRREQLRLSDLAGPLARAGTMIDYLRKKLAWELGRDGLTREEYVRWLARTLGEQFAIMEYFGFDIGTDQGRPQLHPGNVSLLAEIFDSETSKFVSRIGNRYHDNPDMNEDYVDREHIRKLQEKWKGSNKGGIERHVAQDWLSALLHFAPHVDFYGELSSARYSKLAQLRRLRIDPKQRIRVFNGRRWAPFIKGVRD